MKRRYDDSIFKRNMDPAINHGYYPDCFYYSHFVGGGVMKEL
jgi:hypothetical protein